MNEEPAIIRQVYAAKTDREEADRLIGAYMPFIRSETAKFLKRPPVEGHDDELSIAMIAFHEAVQGYSRARGPFLKYAAMLIRSRLIDYRRKEQRHGSLISLDTPTEKENVSLGDTLADDKNQEEATTAREATRAEIEELTRQMAEFGVSLTDVADNCPRQQRTLDACRKALQYAVNTDGLLADFLQSRKLPIARLSAGSGVEKKTLERHRKYMVALMLIYTNGYEIIRGHIRQVLKGGTAR